MGLAISKVGLSPPAPPPGYVVDARVGQETDARVGQDTDARVDQDTDARVGQETTPVWAVWASICGRLTGILFFVTCQCAKSL